MGLLSKKPDLISDKARALESEIAALEAEIKKLDSQVTRTAAASPKLRSTAMPAGEIISRTPEKPAPPAKPSEPVFEEVKAAKISSGALEPELFNDLGVRKYDLPELFNRVRNHFSGPTTSNPRLVNYLAAGGVQGLRPLRYEKRVARNRFIVLVVIVTLVLAGLFVIFLPRH